MEFNELKMIRHSQNEKSLNAMRIIQHRNKESNRRNGQCFAGKITVGVMCGGLMLVFAGMLSFTDLTLAWLATLPWVKVAALTAAAIAKWRRPSSFPRAT